MLTPRRLLDGHLARSADLERALEIARRFDISRQAAMRRYVDLHPERLAAVFSQNGRIDFIEKSDGFPATGPWIGDEVGQMPAPPRDGTDLTGLDEVDPQSWLRYRDRHQVFAQTLYQRDGYSATLLLAEPLGGPSAEWEPPVFQRSGRRR